MPNKVKIYGKPDCPYCENAKMWAKTKSMDIEYLTINKDYTVEELQEAVESTGNRFTRSVPKIFVNGEFIGGFTEFRDRF
ncbi:glutaredoxin [Endozoicomonas sp. 4G]|uniref:glutaredoxin family protein n=1 Tax=Endozoicomonas sp. 4G TaxID=2872754 RepID=UPI00207878EA|nr:glutaredoxin [Endozoicomonas sp. 4G]